MPTSLVTGGAGFLGSHICDFLLERGHRVVCVDNLETGSLNNIKHIREPGFRFEMVDITEHYANVVATLALFAVLGGTSYAALTITGKNVTNSSLTGRDVKNSSLTTADVKASQLPAGQKGDTGARGVPGAPGAAGATNVTTRVTS